MTRRLLRGSAVCEPRLHLELGNHHQAVDVATHFTEAARGEVVAVVGQRIVLGVGDEIHVVIGVVHNVGGAGAPAGVERIDDAIHAFLRYVNQLNARPGEGCTGLRAICRTAGRRYLAAAQASSSAMRETTPRRHRSASSDSEPRNPNRRSNIPRSARRRWATANWNARRSRSCKRQRV